MQKNYEDLDATYLPPEQYHEYNIKKEVSIKIKQIIDNLKIRQQNKFYEVIRGLFNSDYNNE